ncbi:MAG: hypothetical protein C0602_11505 [Denitrovibrio sp.]|nr:MAG: hypothetical protein C0602_11505 [Denitrovibrio sp.]
MPAYIPGIIFLLFVACLCSILTASLFHLHLSSATKMSVDLKRKTTNLKSAVNCLKRENRNMSGVLSDLLNSNKLTKQELTELLKKQSEKNLEEQKFISSIIRKISTEV